MSERVKYRDGERDEVVDNALDGSGARARAKGNQEVVVANNHLGLRRCR